MILFLASPMAQSHYVVTSNRELFNYQPVYTCGCYLLQLNNLYVSKIGCGRFFVNHSLKRVSKDYS